MSTSKGFRLLLIAAAATALGWLGYAAAGASIARTLSARIGPALVAKAQGKFTDPAVFIQGRGKEALLLATALVVLWALVLALDWLLARRPLYRSARGIWLGLIGFAAVNLWTLAAGQTALFWSLFFNRTYTDNFAQFQIKKRLMPEQSAPRKAMLIGNSQTQSNLDELIMNRMIADQLWTTEMHQSGTTGFDLLLLMRDLQKADADLLICYVSAGYFYGRTNGKVAAQFFNFRELPDLLRLRGWSYFPEGALRSGLFSSVLPLFHYRLSFTQRLLGGEISHLEQRQFDASLETDLPQQAHRRAPSLHLGPVADFEKAAFAQTVSELTAAGRTLILIAGQMYPVLEEEMDPAIHGDMTQFLRGLEQRHPGKVTVLAQEEFFQPTREDFRDLVHLTTDGQERMTQKLVEVLKERFLRTSPR